MQSNATAAESASGIRKWLPLITVCMGTFMLLIDVTIVNVALPDIAKDLKPSFGALQWVIDAYALTLAALVLGAGSLADRVGHRQAYIAGLVLFAAASCACGLAPSSSALVLARGVQGIGAAAMFATTFALLNSSYQGRERGTAYGMWGAVAGASAAIGPIVGGLLTEGFTWRAIFFVNLPVSVLAIVLCVRVLVDEHQPLTSRIDLPGIAIFTAAAAAATYGLIRANEAGWAKPGSWGYLVAAVLMLAAFVVLEKRSPAPMLDLSLFTNRPFVGILVAAGLLTFAAFAGFAYTSIWLQSVLGLSPIQAGLIGLPLSLAAFGVSAGMGRVITSAAPGPVIAGGLVLVGIGGVVGGLLVHGDARWPALLPGYLIVGIGAGMATPTLSSAAMGFVAPQRGGMAAGAVNTSRQLGFAFGIAVFGSVFAAAARSAFSDRSVPGAPGLARAVAGGQTPQLLAHSPGAARGALDSAVHAAAIAGVSASLWVAGVTALVAAAIVFWMVRPAEAAAASGNPDAPRSAQVADASA